MKNILINSGLSLGSAILFLGGIEFVLRMTGMIAVGPNPPLIFQTSDNPAISYELIPNVERVAYRSLVKTNSLGFRSSEIDPSRLLIAVLGDSITFGYGVENDETIATQLEMQLPQYQFLNAGVPGYHLGQETAAYQEKITPLEPDGIILVFYPNDMNAGTSWLDQDGVLRAEGDDLEDRPSLRCDPIATGILGFLPGGCWLDRHSATYVGIKKFIRMRSSREALVEEQIKSREHPMDDDITDAEIEAYGNQLRNFVPLLPKEMPRTFVLWPDRQLHAISRPKIRAIAEAHGFTVIDLYDTFGNTAKTLSWDSVHPHPETIERAAEVIAEKVSKQKKYLP